MTSLDLGFARLLEGSARPSDVCRTIPVGRVDLPTGRAYVCDPFLIDEVGPLDRVVSPGVYPARVAVVRIPDWGPRVAMAALLFTARRIVSWEPATYSTEHGIGSTFPVDAGLGCFMDAVTASAFKAAVADFYRDHPNGNFYDDLLAAGFKRNADPLRPNHAGDWLLHRLGPDNTRNIAMFATGLGDGLYEPFWAIDDDDRPVALVVDFGIE